MDTKELFDSLLRSVDIVKEKKTTLDQAQAALNTALEAHDDAVSKSRELKKQLDEALSAINPSIVQSEKIRVS